MLFFNQKHYSNSHRLLSLGNLHILPLVSALFFVAAILGACEDEKKEIISGTVDPETTPTMTTRDVVTLISDSGITRYHINTPLWNVFDEAEEPSWKFPEGLHIQTYDMKMKPDATIDCDTATFLKDKQIWHLKGYVNIRNTLGEKFLTQELFWDQRQRKVYSDSFIHIEREKKIIEGYGFESNETMTNYYVKQVSGIFPAEQFKSDSTRRAATPNAPNATEPPAEPKQAPAPAKKAGSTRKVNLSQSPNNIQSIKPVNDEAFELIPSSHPKPPKDKKQAPR